MGDKSVWNNVFMYIKSLWLFKKMEFIQFVCTEIGLRCIISLLKNQTYWNETYAPQQFALVFFGPILFPLGFPDLLKTGYI